MPFKGSNGSNFYKKSWYRKTGSGKEKIFENIGLYNNDGKFGFHGFKLYFPEDDDNIDVDIVVKNTNLFMNFINKNQSKFLLSDIEHKKFFNVDHKLLFINDYSEDDLEIEWDNIRKEFENNIEFSLNCLSLAMHQTILNEFSKNCQDDDGNVPIEKHLSIIRARLINYEPIIQLKELRTNYFEKLVSVKGTVVKLSSVKIICQYMLFECDACTGTQLLKQSDGIYTLPKKCPTKGCRSSHYTPLQSSPLTRTIAWQSMKLQELIGSEKYEYGRLPRTLDCELTEDLVNSCVLGDDITVTGVLKIQNEESSKLKQNAVFQMNLNVISIVNNKTCSRGSYGASDRIIFNIDDYYCIQKIHSEPKLFRYLVNSLCPNIYGHEIVKAGLLLSLFGGTKCDRTRAESHILIVGEPGLGKSQMLLACTNVAPRGVYICGNISTNAGLTVSMTKRDGENVLEAGALMLADQGCCCIDEFDKIPSQHACLLEIMEQQHISIAKSGIVCSLPARTTILAAANPAGGHYNRSKTIAENLKISSPMLSRFDLIFILLDQPNEIADKMLTKHVLAYHFNTNQSQDEKSNECSNNNSQLLDENDTLKTRLKYQSDETFQCLPHNSLRKYIAYAHKYVNPQLSDEAKSLINDYYLQLRQNYKCGDSTPVTARQLNSLIRLTQARAKIELREEATKNDALDIIEIMEQSLIDIFSNDKGSLNGGQSTNKSGMTTKKEILKLLKLLQQKSETESKSIFNITEIKSLCDQTGINKNKFFTTLETLNLQGFLLNKGCNNYQLVCTDL